MDRANLITQAAALAGSIAAMPAQTIWDCQEQDLAVASVLEMLQAAVEGNGDSWQCMQRCIEDIRCTVDMDREREAEAA
jgi:hypothetical protein